MTKIICAVMALAVGHPAQAQKDTLHSSRLDEVVVTAAKTGLKQSQTGKIVTVLDHRFISNHAGSSLSELLNTQTGFFFNGANNTPGTNIDAYFRGADGGDLLIVVDGVPVYDPSQPNNAFDLNSIPLEQIDRIEILKGGQSTLWGSDAVAGVIQIFLKKETKKPVSANVSAAYGTYNTWRAGAGVNGTAKQLGYSVQYNYTRSDGFSAAYDSTGKNNFDKDGFMQNNLQAELHYAVGKRIGIKAFGNFSTYHNDLDEGAFTDDKDYTAKNTNNIGALQANYHFGKLSWNALLSYQQAKRTFVDDSNDVSSPYSKYAAGHYIGNTLTAETFGNARFTDHLQLVGGLQFIRQNTDQSYLSISDYGPYTSAIGMDSAHTSQFSGYASLLVTGLGGFNMEGGGRISHHSIYGNNATFTLNPSFFIAGHSKIFLNISSAYKIPSLYQLYSEYGNKGLKPESSITYELGLQTESEDHTLYFRLAAFKRDIRSLIIFYTDPVTFASQYVNRDKQNDYGFELESKINLGGIAEWSNNFSFIDGEGTEDNVKIRNLYRRPNFTMNSLLTLQPVSGLTVAPAFKYVGDRLKGLYDIGPDSLPHYYTIDCFVAYSIKHIRFFAEFHNITNQLYFDIPGYNSKRFNMITGVTLTI